MGKKEKETKDEENTFIYLAFETLAFSFRIESKAINLFVLLS